MIDIPLRVLISVTGISLSRWLDLVNLFHACNDETIFNILDEACKTLGLLPLSRIKNNIRFSFAIQDQQKLLLAKLKYNF